MSKKTSKPWQNKAWLYKQYFDNGLSFMKIGNLCGKSSKNIEYWFKKFGFKPRKNGGGKDNPRWKGGRVYDYSGYVRIFHPSNHAYKAKSQKYVSEHILVMEKSLGRKLQKPEVIHHLNGLQDDNQIENLMLFPSNKEHKQFEQQTETFAKKILYGDLAPHLKDELNKLFNDFLSSVNER